MSPYFTLISSRRILTLLSFVFGIMIPVAITTAQSEESISAYTDIVFCPIESPVTVSFTNLNEGEALIEDVFYAEATISNNSSYTMGGIRLGIGAYPSAASAEEPAYWMVTSDVYQLQPGEVVVVPIEADVTTLPAGTYTIKPAAVQGNESAMLGTLFKNEIWTSHSASVRKTGVQQNHATLQVAVDEVALTNTVTEMASGRADIKVTIENNRSVPLVDSQALVVLSEGSIPLGTAVWAERKQAVTLIPGANQNIFLRNAELRSGEYTVFGAMLTEGVLQPIIKRTLSLPGENAGRWQYLSKVGLSEYPLRTDSAVIACLSPVEYSEVEAPYRFSELFGFSFSLKTKDGQERAETIYTDSVDVYDYVVFWPKVRGHDLQLITALLQDRFEGARYITEDNISDRDEIIKDGLVTVTSISQRLVCVDEELCGGVLAEVSPQSDTKDGPSPWFYWAVTLAAALLGYLILRRLSPEEGQVSDKKLNKDELQ